MRKIQFGCGNNYLEGWENYDIDVDITKPLPFDNESADFLLASHVSEHITQQELYNFLLECKRILTKNGILRIITPNLLKIAYEETENYRKFVKDHNWGNGEKGCGVRAILFEHGHLFTTSPEIIKAILYSIGMESEEVDVYESKYPELNNLNGHHQVIGKEFNSLESCCIETRKPQN